jgi:Zn-dependent protease
MLSLPSRFYVSEREVGELLIATLVMAVVFSYPLLFVFPITLLIVATGLIFHELAHKLAAINIGYYAEFRMSPAGLLTSLVASVASGGLIKMGIPGAVHISGGMVEEREMAQIALAGPLANLVTALFFGLGKYLMLPLALPIVTANWSLALYNMLPIPPLDGHHVLRYNRMLWASIFSLALACGISIL